MKREFIRLCEAMVDAIKAKDFDLIPAFKDNLKLIQESEWVYKNRLEVVESHVIFSYAVIKNDYELFRLAATIMPLRPFVVMLNEVTEDPEMVTLANAKTKKSFELI